MFTLGWPEVAIIAAVVLIIFGPKKIPEVGRALGKSLRSFKDEIGNTANKKEIDAEDSQKS